MKLISRILQSARHYLLTPPMIIYWAALVVCFASLYLLTLISRDYVFGLYLRTEVFYDAVILLIPFFFLSPRFRWSVWIPVIACPIYAFVNQVYARAFGDLMPPESIFMASQLHGEVLDASLDCIRWTDALQLLPVLFFGVIWWRFGQRASHGAFTWRNRIIALIATLMGFGANWCIRAAYLQSGTQDSYSESVCHFYTKGTRWINTQSQIVSKVGFSLYFVHYLHSSFTKHTISAAERAEIDSFMASAPAAELPDSLAAIFAQNRDKNLIFIVVESLSSAGVDAHINGRPVAPFLYSLLSDSDALVFDHVLPQVSHGRSSDGQFIYQTGLYCMRASRIATDYSRQDYPSLAKALKPRFSAEVICEHPIFYNHIHTNRSFGFDRLYAASSHSWLTDGMVLDSAIVHIKEAPRPFYFFITTISMHDPYESLRTPRKFPETVDGLDPRELIYLERLAHTDSQLRKFVATLRREGLYDNSVIVIASDHEPRASLLPEDSELPKNCMFMVLNSGISGRQSRVVGQIDVFPTILHVMGVNSYPWRGLGRSLVADPDAHGAIDVQENDYGSPSPQVAARMRRAWHISELMIRGNYYGMTN